MTGFKAVRQALGQHGPLAAAVLALLALGLLLFRPAPPDEPAAFSTFAPPVNRVAFVGPVNPPARGSLLTPEGVARTYIQALAEGNPDAVVRLTRPGSRSLDLTPGYGVPGFGLVWLEVREVGRTADRVEFTVRGLLGDGERADPGGRRIFQGRLTVRWADGSWYVEAADLSGGRN